MAVERMIPQWIHHFVPSAISVYAVLCVAIVAIVSLVVKRRKFIQRVDRVPGMPGGMTVLGNTPMIVVSPDEVFSRVIGYVHMFRSSGPVLRVWAGPFPLFFIFTAEAAETLLSSNKLIDKSREYEFLHDWLNTGLLTSTGSKWFGRRKMLTPAFHFKILDDFVHVFNEQSKILLVKLSQAAQKHGDIDIYPYITRCTLDIICEAAMGRHVDAQNHSDSDYVQAVYKTSHVVQMRQARPWLQPELLFQLSKYGAEQRKCLKILHDFTDKVIRERKLEHKERKNRPVETVTDGDDIGSVKRRLAFLDLLIESSKDGQVLSDTDIREEVDTFMFEGHDTTAAAISWSLLMMGSYPKVQDKVQEELGRVFGDSDRPASISDLNELKYLECCIKEALRLYPSVPIMGRRLTEDVTFHGYEVPKGTSVLLMTYVLHRDAKSFPDPEVYDPDRFLAENQHGRHPYAYVPFSAGPRNCIGQKFALLEEKVVLSSILRRFHVEAMDKRDELVLLGELILRPRDGIRLRLTPRVAR
uniref:CYP4C122 n=1 Tax=Diaphanosoma celebensis TaxID=2184134 RepID=A0A896SZD2_9CRUS|nr:CYP4C122 [Diaphanosoma celebensis]QST15031.1 CYP4C33-like protein 2 [Diaphanosoma celebensis]